MSVSSLLWYPSLGSLPLSWLLRVHGGHPQTSLYPGGSVLEQVMPDALLSPHCGTAGLLDVTSLSGCPKVTLPDWFSTEVLQFFSYLKVDRVLRALLFKPLVTFTPVTLLGYFQMASPVLAGPTSPFPGPPAVSHLSAPRSFLLVTRLCASFISTSSVLALALCCFDVLFVSSQTELPFLGRSSLTSLGCHFCNLQVPQLYPLEDTIYQLSVAHTKLLALDINDS